MNSHVRELHQLIIACATDSNKLLELESQIDQAVKAGDTRNVFGLLVQIVGEQGLDGDERFLACVVLKNTLRNHVAELRRISP